MEHKATPWIAAAVLLMPALAQADARIEMSTDKAEGGTLVMQVKDGKTRWEQDGDARGSVLYDAATKTLTVLNHGDKTYMKLDKAAVQGVSEQMKAAMKQMEAQMANMPPEQREMIMKRMPGFAAQEEKPVFSAEKAGGSDKVNGIKCRNMRLLKDGQPYTDACVADADAMDIPEADFETLAAMFESMQEMASQFSGGRGALPLREIGGMPVRSVNVETGEVSEVVSVSDDSLDGALFEVPAGYRLQEMPTF